MNKDDPLIVMVGPLNRDLARSGMAFMKSLLGPTTDIASSHPLRSMFEAAEKHGNAGDLIWGASRECNLLAMWGLQLWRVKEWGGFEYLIERIKADCYTWDAHMEEGLVAAMFSWAGCNGRFFNKDEQGPDLHVVGPKNESYIECRRSRSLASEEHNNWSIWQPLTFQILERIKVHTPSAVVGFYPKRDATADDMQILNDGIEHAIAKHVEALRTAKPQSGPGAPHWSYTCSSSDRSFDMKVFFGTDPDSMFDAACGQFNSIEIPGGVEPLSLSVVLELTQTPTCQGFWLAKVKLKPPWERIQKAILKRLDKKAHQLNRFWRENSTKLAQHPSIIWIDHPPILTATKSELGALASRIKGKLHKNESGHWNGVSAVVLSDSRMVINKCGQVSKQLRMHFVSNDQHGDLGSTPYVTWTWWEDVMAGRLPPTTIMDGTVQLRAQQT